MGEQNCQVPMEEAFVLSVETSTSSHGEQELLLLLLLLQVSTVCSYVYWVPSFWFCCCGEQASKQAAAAAAEQEQTWIPVASRFIGSACCGWDFAVHKEHEYCQPNIHERAKELSFPIPPSLRLIKFNFPLHQNLCLIIALSLLDLFKNWCHVVVHSIIGCWNARLHFWSCCLPACAPAGMETCTSQICWVPSAPSQPNLKWSSGCSHKKADSSSHVIPSSSGKSLKSLQLWMWLGTCGRVPEGSLTTAYGLSFSEPKSSSLSSLSLFASIPGKPKDSSMFKKKPREWVQLLLNILNFACSSSPTLGDFKRPNCNTIILAP